MASHKPTNQYLQTLAVTQWVLSLLFLGLTCTIFAIWLAFTRAWPLIILYGVWYYYDKNTPFIGGRRMQWPRRWKIWEYLRDYFPLELLKTTDLDPGRNYLLACHPHGIFSISHFTNFGTEATGFSDLFPYTIPHLIVLAGGLKFPFFREYFLTAGVCASEKPSLEYLLSQRGGGHAACLIIGGATESLDSRPGSFRLNLQNKKGFIKSAIRTGAELVPVYSFGENDLYSQASHHMAKRVQEWIIRNLGFTVPLAYGRGIILPYRKPVTTVVGKPIPVTQNAEPSQEEVDQLHAVYVESLTRLFETHKQNYGIAQEQHLQFY